MDNVVGYNQMFQCCCRMAGPRRGPLCGIVEVKCFSAQFTTSLTLPLLQGFAHQHSQVWAGHFILFCLRVSQDINTHIPTVMENKVYTTEYCRILAETVITHFVRSSSLFEWMLCFLIYPWVYHLLFCVVTEHVEPNSSLPVGCLSVHFLSSDRSKLWICFHTKVFMTQTRPKTVSLPALTIQVWLSLKYWDTMKLKLLSH